MRKAISVCLVALCVVMFALAISFLTGCDDSPTSDKKQSQQQETILQEATSTVGMPAIKNFRERRLLKDVYELRDQNGLATYTYLYNEYAGKLVFLCDSVGYGIPYATQFTSPQRPVRNWETQMQGNVVLPQADPNGLFSPQAAEGTWVICKDPHGSDTKTVYIEPRIVVSPFKLD